MRKARVNVMKRFTSMNKSQVKRLHKIVLDSFDLTDKGLIWSIEKRGIRNGHLAGGTGPTISIDGVRYSKIHLIHLYQTGEWPKHDSEVKISRRKIVQTASKERIHYVKRKGEILCTANSKEKADLIRRALRITQQIDNVV